VLKYRLVTIMIYYTDVLSEGGFDSNLLLV